MGTSSTILGSSTGTITYGQEKFTWSRQWESLFASKGQSTSFFTNPKTFSPSKYREKFVKDDLDM
jgi:hypothetical protein